MLRLAVILLLAAVLFGAALTVAILRRSAGPPPRMLAAWHGLFALAGLGVTIAALLAPHEGPPRGAATGTESFGVTAAVLLLVAALAGAVALLLHIRRRRMLGFALGAHASIAIFGFVILAVYLLAG